MKFNRTEYPRPQFARKIWQPLNGEWEFDFDDENLGEVKGFHLGIKKLSKKINVPFAYQTKASGIGELTHHEIMWYRREFKLNHEMKGERVILCFNAVDYEATIFINGNFVTVHKNGYTYFEADITPFLSENNNIVIKVVDRYDVSQPRGKQYWKEKTDRCWYHGTSGIWQSVWLERSGETRILSALLTTDIDKNGIEIEMETSEVSDALEMEIFYKGTSVKKQKVSLNGKTNHIACILKPEDSIDEVNFWYPWEPNLYNVKYRLIKDDKIEDTVETYFGFRKVSFDETGKIYLNNKILYQKLILDQGYWDDSDLTPPTADALKEDIILAKSAGFNGARKHQKIEDPYFYYYADTLGFLVWGEMPSAYDFNFSEVQNITSQYTELVRQLYNHPSIIAWVPMNESWGIRKNLTCEKEKNFVRSLYRLTKALDSTRLVSSNDGWENVEENDICSIHDYAAYGTDFKEKYKKDNLSFVYPMGRRLMAHGESYKNIPVIMTEYGGIAFVGDVFGAAWGYGNAEKDVDSFIKRFKSLNKGIFSCDFAGYCYTQLTDVKQEVNGILDANHKPKFNLDLIAAVNNGEVD